MPSKVAYTTTPASDRMLWDVVLSSLQPYSDLFHGDGDFENLIRSGLGEGGFALDVFGVLEEHSEKDATFFATSAALSPSSILSVSRCPL